MKRLFDLIVVIVVFPILLPIIVILVVLVRINLGSPVIFAQERPGMGSVPFYMLKFRTMLDKRDESGNLLPDKERMTKFGSWMRATSLDELPELWNVLTGEMSLVGPRPLLMEYLPLYTPDQARRHDVRPGITGWAQVNGRNAITWETKFRLDVWYVDNHSLLLDMKILWMTLTKVLKKADISQTGHVTMEKFTGSQNYNDRQI